MSKRATVLLLCLAFVHTGCDSSDVVHPELESTDQSPRSSVHASVERLVTGGGYFTVAGFLEVQFSLSAVQTSTDGLAVGRAHHSVQLDGQLIEFHTRVTCVTFDPANGRAWIGGVITQNNSVHPDWQEDTQEVGDDIWFRVVDYGEGESATQPDRSTFVGFEGGAGIITSEEYCDAQLWPEGDARTSPTTEGNIQVRVR